MTREILFIAHRVPYPPNRGDKIRSWHMLCHMATFARVHLVALYDDPRDAEHVEFLKTVCASVHIEPRNPSKVAAMLRGLTSGRPASVEAFATASLQRAVDDVIASNDISTIFAFSGQMAQYVPLVGPHRFVMDFVDMDSAKFAAFADAGSGPLSWANRAEAGRLLAFETVTAQRAAVSLFVSDAEATLFRQTTGIEHDKVGVIENGIDIVAYDPALPFAPVSAPAGPLIVFTGQMDYQPNCDAVATFARTVMPTIRAAHPTAQFAIVGRNPIATVQSLAAIPGVIVTGEVPDTRAWLAASTVVVAPLMLARGIQNKVLEAMAMAKPVVASSAAALGIDAQPSTEMIIADLPADQAQAVNDLLTSSERRAQIGAAARARIEARYTWGAQLAGLQAVIAGEHVAQVSA